MKLKALVAIIAALALSVTGSAFALAETDDAVIEDVVAEEAPADAVVEDAVEEPIVIERSETWTNDFDVLFIDRVEDNSTYSVCYYKSVQDAVAYYADGLYYPAYEGYVNASNAHIIYAKRGVNAEGPAVFQIEYPRDDLEICWIKMGVTFTGESMNPNAEKYESHGTVFYIGEYWEEGPNGFGGHYTEGILEGNCYSFFTKTAEEAKLIIDSLTKAE